MEMHKAEARYHAEQWRHSMQLRHGRSTLARSLRCVQVAQQAIQEHGSSEIKDIVEELEESKSEILRSKWAEQGSEQRWRASRPRVLNFSHPPRKAQRRAACAWRCFLGQRREVFLFELSPGGTSLQERVNPTESEPTPQARNGVKPLCVE